MGSWYSEDWLVSAFDQLAKGSAYHLVWISEDRRSARLRASGKDALRDFQAVVREAEQAQDRGELSIVLVHPIAAGAREYSSIVIVRSD